MCENSVYECVCGRGGEGGGRSVCMFMFVCVSERELEGECAFRICLCVHFQMHVCIHAYPDNAVIYTIHN